MSPDPSPPRFDFIVPSSVALAQLDADSDTRPLHPAEEALIHPRATATRRREFRSGRHAAHRALAELGRDEGPVLRGSHREPLWPSGVVGSITHGAGSALAAVAHRTDCGGIGLDVEHIDRVFPELIDQIATPAERTQLGGLDDELRRRAVLEVFAAKECIYKALFPRVGRYFGFEAAEVQLVDDATTLQGRLLAPLLPGFPPDRRFEIQVRWCGDVVGAALFLPPGD